jgi:hypothetical protein
MHMSVCQNNVSVEANLMRLVVVGCALLGSRAQPTMDPLAAPKYEPHLKAL